MFSAPDCVAFGFAYAAWSGVPPCACADDSPGFGSHVGREFAQSLGTRLLVSALHGMGATHSLNYILFYIYDNLRKFFIVLFSTVINDASLGCYKLLTAYISSYNYVYNCLV